MASYVQKNKLLKRVRRDKYLLVMLALPVLFFLIFSYIPMLGLLIGFQDFKMGAGFFGSPFVGLKWFREFWGSVYFLRLIGNTFLLSFYSLIFTFPVPIIFALLLNEIPVGWFKRTVQTVSYLPHFISVVVVGGLLFSILSPNDGIVNHLIQAMGGERINFLAKPEWFRPLYILSGLWQEFGWSSIIYLAALSGVDSQLYEAAVMDGAGRMRQTWHITLPGIRPTILMLLILSVGSMFNVGYEKIILMYSSATYSTADVFSTYLYRTGVVNGRYSLGVAAGLFNSVISFALLWSANYASRKMSEVSMW